MRIFGIKLVGVDTQTGTKVLFTLALVGILWLLQLLVRTLMRRSLRGRAGDQTRFWARQGISLATAALGLLGLLSIWFNDPGRLATAIGLVTAGIAFALQKVITSFAGYFVILRGKTFSVGDRIVMGGVRGDVIALGFIQTTLMEMGQPPPVQSATPAVWVQSRQYTGRIVTVTNDQIFAEPVFNYTRDFPYLWEEIALPIPYKADRAKVEAILLDCASRHTAPFVEGGRASLAALRRRYAVRDADLEPRVYYRLTDNWLELTVRFIVEAHGIRDLKDAMSRDILTAFDAAGIGLASGTYAIVELPTLRIEHDGAPVAMPRREAQQ